MGRSISYKYRVEIRDDARNPPIRMVWRTADYGQANAENLQKHVIAHGKSLELGGANEHLSLDLGYIPYPISARLVHQKSGEVVATWKAAMFQVW